MKTEEQVKIAIEQNELMYKHYYQEWIKSFNAGEYGDVRKADDNMRIVGASIVALKWVINGR